MDSWLLKLLSENMNAKTNQAQSTSNQKVKINKVNAMANITSTMDHYPRNGYMGIPILNLVCHVNPGNE